VDIGVFVTDDFLRATKVGIVINRLTRNENENPAIAKLARKIISKWRATTSNRKMSARLQAINQQHSIMLQEIHQQQALQDFNDLQTESESKLPQTQDSS
jgi:hypothetical protein